MHRSKLEMIWLVPRALLLVIALSAGATGTARADGVPVEAQRVTAASIANEVAAIGSIKSNESVVIRPEIAGIVVKIGFDEGSEVTKGQLLISLDDSIYQAELRQAEAELQLAQRTYDRANDLFEQKVGPAQTRDEALARLTSATAALELAKVRQEKTRITAPFSGVIGLRQASIGTYVTPGQAIVNLEDIDPVKIDFNLAERYLSALRVGQGVSVRVDPYPDRMFPGTIYAIDPQLDVNGRSIAVRARADNHERLLRPGLFARVKVALEVKEAAIMIPEEAIVPRGAERFVFKIVDGKAVRTEVETGMRLEGKVEIVKGLSTDDVVVTAGHQKLRDGMPVTQVPADQAADG